MSNIASASPARGPHLASAGRGADYIKNGSHDAILHTATGLHDVLIWDGSQQPASRRQLLGPPVAPCLAPAWRAKLPLVSEVFS